MSLSGEQVLLRVYLQSADRKPFSPTHERIISAARKQHLAGATVLKGILGAGSHGLIKGSAWSIAEHIPIVVEIVDSAERILEFINGPMEKLMVNGMATI